MNRPDAENLLGGYATGTLTDAEKQVLFAAALEHQELFDALADEEALREVLADPEARKRLLAVLPALEGTRIRPLWRRPAVIGLAASLFALVTTSLLVWQSPRYRSLPAEASTPSRIAEHAGQDKPEAALASEAVQKPASTASPKATRSAKPLARAESGTFRTAPQAPAAGNFASEKDEQKSADRLDASLPPAQAAPSAAGAVVAGVQMAKKTKQAGAGFTATEQQPFQSTLEHLQGSQARLTVLWDSRGHLYVLQRTPAGVSVLSPGASTPGKPGMRSARFDLALGEQDAVDVYVLREPVADPRFLSATGDVQGERRRIYPE